MDFGEFCFRARGYIPVPFALGMLFIPYKYSLWRPDAGNVSAFGLICISGLSLICLGEWLRIVAVAYSSPATRTRNVGASCLFSDGPYAYVRNPLYIGNFLILAGMMTMSWSGFPWYSICCFIIFWIEYYMIIRVEEKALVRDLGEAYVIYKQNVPRILPLFKPYKQSSQTPKYKAAFKSEIHSLRTELILIVLIAVRWYIILS